MHPIFAAKSASDCLLSSRNTSAVAAHSSTVFPPIFYDVTLPPSRKTVRCKPKDPQPTSKSKIEAVPTYILSEPATDPPTRGTLVLVCERFPWTVTVYGGCSNSSTVGAGEIVTNSDVLHALYYTLNCQVTRGEWDELPLDTPRSSSVPPSTNSTYAAPIARLGLSKKRVGRAWQKRRDQDRVIRGQQRSRAQASSGRASSGGWGEVDETDWEEGVRRVDWLMGRTRLVGIVVDREAGRSLDGVEGRAVLVFDKPLPP